MNTLVAFGIGLNGQFFLLFSLFLLLFISPVTLFCTISARMRITSRNNLSEELVNGSG